MKTKILVLLKSVDGGTGTYLEGLLGLPKLFESGQLEMKVVVLERPRFRTINIDGYSFFSVKKTFTDKYSLSLKNIQIFVNEIKWFKKHVEGFGPDVVISSDSHSILISEIAKHLFRFRYKTISLIQNNLRRVIEFRTENFLRLPIKMLLKFFINKSDEIVTVAEQLSRDLYIDLKLRKYPKTIQAILPLRFQKDEKHIKIPSRGVILTISRLDSQKDNETLLKAFQLVTRFNTDSELWIVGDGPLKSSLKLLVQHLGISKRTRFLGWIQDPIEIMDKSNLFVLSSKWEGFPLSLLEAMARGLPVVASDCQYGPSEILGKNRFGILVQTGDFFGLAEAIILLLSNRKEYEYYSRMAWERSLNYSSEKMLLRYKKILKRIIRYR